MLLRLAPKSLLLAIAALLHGAVWAQAAPGVPLMNPPLQAKPAARAPAAGAPKTINWEALMPANWDPFKDLKDINLQAMDDGDPRTAALLKKMREVWDNAPANPALVGQNVRLPGFVVPLEDSKDGLKEFLLVPYFGACIHSPPPPSNQIVHVVPKTPVKGFRSMDTVWIVGPLSVARTDSYMGASSYRIEATSVLAYEEKAK